MRDFAIAVLDSCGQIMKVPRAVFWAVVTAVFLVFTAVLGILFAAFGWPWAIFAGIVGAQFGLAFGVVILVKVPAKAQIAAVGAITGMGIDQIISSASKSESVSGISTLAKVVSNIVSSATSATEQTGLPSPAQFPLSVGLWIFFGIVGLMMLFGSLEPTSD
jgi:hypothetical protein